VGIDAVALTAAIVVALFTVFCSTVMVAAEEMAAEYTSQLKATPEKPLVSTMLELLSTAAAAVITFGPATLNCLTLVPKFIPIDIFCPPGFA
jgi:uncharacterized membrane protein YoaK (UPF0700 family)